MTKEYDMEMLNDIVEDVGLSTVLEECGLTEAYVLKLLLEQNEIYEEDVEFFLER